MEPRSPTLQADSLPAEPRGKPNNTGVGSLSLLQGIFPPHGWNPGLPHCRQILYQLSHEGSPTILEWVASPFSRGVFLAQGLNPRLPHCRRILYSLRPQRSRPSLLPRRGISSERSCQQRGRSGSCPRRRAGRGGTWGRAVVTHLSTSFLANPKSVSFTWPSLSSRMFSGFRSL